MPFWRKETPEEKERKALQKRTVEALNAGSIPPIARERIERQMKEGDNFFTSDLTAAEYLLTRESDFHTIGQVMGTAFFNVSYWGMMRTRSTFTGEMVQLSEAQMKARKVALARLTEEARLMGASGVIGVRIQSGRRDWSGGLQEFTAIGTAVRIPGFPEGDPFVCDLSGQEFWQLHRAGYKPTGIAFGVCSYYMAMDARTQSIVAPFLGIGSSNQEVPLYTEGCNDARRRAMNHFTQDLFDHLADGAVGMEITYDIEEIEYESGSRTYHDLLCHFVAMGTSVVVVEKPAHVEPVSPVLCLNLSGTSLAVRKGSRMQELASEFFEEDLYDEDGSYTDDE